MLALQCSNAGSAYSSQNRTVQGTVTTRRDKIGDRQMTQSAKRAVPKYTHVAAIARGMHICMMINEDFLGCLISDPSGLIM